MMEAVRTAETSGDNYFTRQYNPEDSSERGSNPAVWGSYQRKVGRVNGHTGHICNSNPKLSLFQNYDTLCVVVITF
jgi:hypothetical protein